MDFGWVGDTLDRVEAAATAALQNCAEELDTRIYGALSSGLFVARGDVR